LIKDVSQTAIIVSNSFLSAKKTDWTVGVRIGAGFVGFRDRDNFCGLPGIEEVAQP